MGPRVAVDWHEHFVYETRCYLKEFRDEQDLERSLMITRYPRHCKYSDAQRSALLWTLIDWF